MTRTTFSGLCCDMLNVLMRAWLRGNDRSLSVLDPGTDGSAQQPFHDTSMRGSESFPELEDRGTTIYKSILFPLPIETHSYLEHLNLDNGLIRRAMKTRKFCRFVRYILPLEALRLLKASKTGTVEKGQLSP